MSIMISSSALFSKSRLEQVVFLTYYICASVSQSISSEREIYRILFALSGVAGRRDRHMFLVTGTRILHSPSPLKIAEGICRSCGWLQIPIWLSITQQGGNRYLRASHGLDTDGRPIERPNDLTTGKRDDK